MRYIVIFFFLVICLFGGNYIPYSQLTNKNYLDLFSKVQPGESVELSAPIYLQYEGSPSEQYGWCYPGIQRYKIFIPKNLEYVKILLSATPKNISYFVLERFVPIDNPPILVDFTNVRQMIDVDDSFLRGEYTALKKVANVSAIFEVYKPIPVNGWLYIAVIQASKLMPSYMGHVNNPRVIVAASYKIPNDPQWKENFLDTTNFDVATKDPIDGFDAITEKNRYCYDFGKEEIIYGKSSGIPGNLLVQGITTLDTNIPILKTQTSQVNGNVNVEVSFKTQQKAIQGIDIEINGNITRGLLISMNPPSCLEFKGATTSEGEILYSDNGVNWYQTDEYGNSYLSFFLPEQNGQAMQASKILTYNMSFNNGCDQANLQLSAKFILDGNEKELTKQILLLKTAVNSNISNSNAGSTSTTYNDGGNSGGSTTTTTAITTTTVDNTALKEQCESEGNIWSFGQCFRRSGTETSTGTENTSTTYNDGGNSGGSTTTATTTTTVDNTALKEQCESEGNIWSFGQCFRRSGTETSTGTSSSEDQGSMSSQSQKKDSGSNKIVEVVYAIVKKHNLPVEGYFVHYGAGAFDWIYRTAGGGLYKLDGMDENGYFQWTDLSNYFSKVEIVDNKLVIDEQKKTRALEVPNKRVSQVVERLLEQKEFPIDGYFVHYGDGAFDWALRTANGEFYKLDGMNVDGYFEWVNLSDYFSKVEIVDNKLVVGEPKNIDSSSSSAEIDEEAKLLEQMKQNCKKAGGTWDEDLMLCIKVVEENSASSQSAQSSSSSSQSSSSVTSSTSSSSESAQSSSSNAFPNLS